MLVGKYLRQRHDVAFLHQGQASAFILIFLGLLVTAFFIDGKEARLDHGCAGGAERMLRTAGEIDRNSLHLRRSHLAGDGALPDQVVKFQLIRIQERRDHLGRVQGRGRADRLMRFLRILGLGLVDVRCFRKRLVAITLGDDFAQLDHGVDAEMHGIGTHIGNQADQALGTKRHTFVQTLGQAHGAAGAETKLARGFLLQGRGDERRRRFALALLAHHFGDLQCAIAGAHQFRTRSFRRGAIAEGELLDLLTVVTQQARIECLRGMGTLRSDRPVFLRLEGFDLFLTLADQAQSRRLHATGGKTGLHLAPQHRAQVEANEIIKRAPCLLRIDQIDLQAARMCDSFVDRLRGDLRKHHAMQAAAFKQSTLTQDLADVPADRLTLAIQVGCEI